MKKIIYLLVFFYLASLSKTLSSQSRLLEMYLKNNQTIFRIDIAKYNRITDSMLFNYGFSGLNLDSLILYNHLGKYAQVGWGIYKRKKNYIELSKPVMGWSPQKNRHWQRMVWHTNSVIDLLNPDFGINIFKNETTVYCKKDSVYFSFTGSESAKSVILSGSFNQWNTNQLQMSKSTSGKWSIRLQLKPGKYSYKFIEDGNWKPDPENMLKEDDQWGSFNSVFYVPNYVFTYQSKSISDSHVFLAGSFNQWQKIPLIKENSTFVLPCFLREGNHQYKFVVNGNWILDPKNSETVTDGEGNVNSKLNLGKPAVFELKGYPNARFVFLSGQFNNWKKETLPLIKLNDSIWRIELILPPGLYEYKFIVDGNWILDPSNAIVQNQNSLKIHKANHLFQLTHFPNAKTVFVTGSFCDWKEPGVPMIQRNGVWVLPVFLPSGRNSYKFIVDGNWITDPANAVYEDNEFGTGNSVLWIP